MKRLIATIGTALAGTTAGYVLHQTITIIAGYYLTEYELGVAVESALVLTITVLGCVIGYEIIRRIPVIGILFGVHRVSGYRSGR